MSVMTSVQHLLHDILRGSLDSVSGWWVAVQCWREEAKKVKDKPAPPPALEQLRGRRDEERNVPKRKDEGTLSSIIWSTVTTAGVALLITFLIQTGCSFVANLFGPSYNRGLSVSSLVLQCLWWFPSMAVIKLTSIINNNEVADKVFLFKYGRPKFIPIGASISEFIFSCIYQTLFIVQADVSSMLVPWAWLSHILSWLHYSLFYALYAFEYKWASLGIPGHTRVAQIENNWCYYFAFGLPIHFAVSFWDSLYTRTMAFTLLFPFSILGATVADSPRSQFSFPLHIMFPSVYITNEAYKFFRRLSGTTKPPRQPESSVRS